MAIGYCHKLKSDVLLHWLSMIGFGPIYFDYLFDDFQDKNYHIQGQIKLLGS